MIANHLSGRHDWVQVFPTQKTHDGWIAFSYCRRTNCEARLVTRHPVGTAQVRDWVDDHVAVYHDEGEVRREELRAEYERQRPQRPDTTEETATHTPTR